MSTRPARPRVSPAWFPVLGSLIAVAVDVAARLRVVVLPAVIVAVIAGVAVAVVVLVTAIEASSHGGTGWARPYVFRVATAATMGAWTTCAVAFGKAAPMGVALVVAATVLGFVGHFCPAPPAPDPRVETPEQVDRRDPVIRKWEAIIRSVSKLLVKITRWEPWETKADGLRLYAELPVDTGTTTADLAAFAGKIAAAARLPRGCAVRVLDSDLQGEVVIDVMLRNSLVDATPPYVEPTTPASINDDFPVLTTPRGEIMSICLRITSMIVGGTVGSGKTTFLHRLIMWLARCVDVLIWVVDLNGGGVAEPWIHAWANGWAVAPVVDWVADSEDEAAVMVAVVGAVVRDRKTNREATRRKRAANVMVLPVDKGMPAIIVLTDEGGELRQATSLLGQLALQGITRLAQIGRAEGGRAIMSVLRGTADLTDKAMRVNAAIRLCLRMEEHDEYGHVLGAEPGKTELSGAVGAGFLRTPEHPRPVLGRTVNVDLAGIERHAIACGPLRPELDEWGLRAAAKVGPVEILGGREPDKELAKLRIMRDAAAGHAYTGRWDRYAAKLAEMRGEDPEEVDDNEPASVLHDNPRTPALNSWAASVLGEDFTAAPTPAAVEPEPVDEFVDTGAQILMFPGAVGRLLAAPQRTAREQILHLVRTAGSGGISAADIERGVDAAHSRVFALLKDLREGGQVETNGSGLYVPTSLSRSTTG